MVQVEKYQCPFNLNVHVSQRSYPKIPLGASAGRHGTALRFWNTPGGARSRVEEGNKTALDTQCECHVKHLMAMTSNMACLYVSNEAHPHVKEKHVSTRHTHIPQVLPSCHRGCQPHKGHTHTTTLQCTSALFFSCQMPKQSHHVPKSPSHMTSELSAMYALSVCMKGKGNMLNHCMGFQQQAYMYCIFCSECVRVCEWVRERC